MIHPLILMRKSNKYIVLCGHRRLKAIKKTDLRKVRARILPELTEEEQLKLMYDEDLFEEVSLHDRARGIARQFNLERDSRGEDYTLEEFCRENRQWASRLVKDAVLYNSLPEQVKVLYQEKLITYRVAIDLARVQNEVEQLDLANSAAILKQSHNKVLKILKEDKYQKTIWPKEEISKMKKEGKRRYLFSRMQQIFSGLIGRMELDDKGKRKFIQDYDLMHRFQIFFRDFTSIFSN